MIRYPVLIITLVMVGILGGIGIGYLIYGSSVHSSSSFLQNEGKGNISSGFDTVHPSSVIHLPDNSILVSDTDEGALYKITENGTISLILNRDAATPFGYWHITGTASDRLGNMYISDASTHRILKFNKRGNLQTSWGGFGSSDGEFDSPQGVTVMNTSTGEEQVLVSDFGNQRIQVFSTNGKYLHSIFVPKEVNKTITIQKPDLQKNQTDKDQYHIKPEKTANPAFVDRTFEIQSSGANIPLSFEINRSVYLGAQKISYNSQDISYKNPEEWIPVIKEILTDKTTQTTLKSTLEELRREANIHGVSNQAKIETIIHFVQQIPLADDTENRYPIEILHDKKGNTYDKALFLYGLLNESGYDVVYLAYPELSHAAVGIRLTDPLQITAIATYQDSNETPYIYVNPDGPSFVGGIAAKYRNTDPFIIHLTKPSRDATSISADHLFSTYVVESIFSLSEKYQFLVNKEKDLKGDDAKKIKENYQKIKSVLDFIEKNPWNTEIAYMRIKNSKVNDIIV